MQPLAYGRVNLQHLINIVKTRELVSHRTYSEATAADSYPQDIFFRGAPSGWETHLILLAVHYAPPNI